MNDRSEKKEKKKKKTINFSFFPSTPPLLVPEWYGPIGQSVIHFVDLNSAEVSVLSIVCVGFCTLLCSCTVARLWFPVR